ncbi:hypothetical protein BD309DRAFT_923364 [Dichomitus squalens]|uniref:Uncharacterized protein n=1 Tax=Dichomitus squalens TaxID=114155 RepID=A0A4Q9PUD6_9APHY|nr:uncharacterized protein DICSQDRAFT_177068 [Dichomitus squalens LYAD-421 SS1]EJF67459.1 hypothetical protein DICSQDRAFT_177068 [Dichomitus squalens LYAD-421 SS1]TBU42539.1 hypothetical protein BD309DRAFT_923364 [Dichomitus squalens]TBU58131.1 hypothetical protein BD310DRAFT_496402 [Dichomitus squalens]
MRAGFFSVLFLSSVFSVHAAPSILQRRDNEVLQNIESAADDLFSINIGSILSEATPVVASVFQEATSIVGSVIASDTALRSEATSIFGEVESILGPAATGIVNNVHEVVSAANGAAQDSVVARPLAMGAAAVLGSMFLGAYVVV